MRDTFVGQQDTSNQGARSEELARGTCRSAGASAAGVRRCSVFE
ncbi:hypothetical protein [Tessaracoccus coleopterorum]